MWTAARPRNGVAAKEGAKMQTCVIYYHPAFTKGKPYQLKYVDGQWGGLSRVYCSMALNSQTHAEAIAEAERLYPQFTGRFGPPGSLERYEAIAVATID